VKGPDKPTLSVINPASTGIEPPRKLGEAGRVLWDRVQAEYRIEDIGGTELLMQCCLAADRAQSLADTIDRDGETIHTKAGLKGHPCLKDELAARSFVVRTLQRLGVTEEVLKPVGRPPKSSGWRGWDAHK
jgi:hypothetical protein